MWVDFLILTLVILGTAASSALLLFPSLPWPAYAYWLGAIFVLCVGSWCAWSRWHWAIENTAWQERKKQ